MATKQLKASPVRKNASTGFTTGESMQDRGMLPQFSVSKAEGIAMCEERIVGSVGEGQNRPDQDGNVNVGVRSNISKG